MLPKTTEGSISFAKTKLYKKDILRKCVVRALFFLS